MSEFVLGTPEYPLIDVVPQGTDEKNYQPELGVRADASLPIRIATNVEPPAGVSLNDYVYGLYIRQLPVRSMLAAANDEIDKRNKGAEEEEKKQIKKGARQELAELIKANLLKDDESQPED